jgi:hypothetical protein
MTIEKEAGFGILNQLPGAKDIETTKAQDKEAEKDKKPKQQQEAEPWLSIWNDALFHEV